MLLNALPILPHLILTATFVGILPSLISSEETELWKGEVACLALRS